MRMRFWGGFALAMLGLVGATAPARSQPGGFRLVQPTNARAAGGFFTIRWTDSDQIALHKGLRTVTWYYATRPDGSDRKRMVTEGHEDFSTGFLRNWRPQGPAQLEWAIKEDRQGKRKILTCAQNVGPAYSIDIIPQDSVVSFLVRPKGLHGDFTLGARIQPPGRGGFEVRTAADRIELVADGNCLAAPRALGISPSKWYWYELGLLTLKNREVEVRLRVFDEKHQQVLVETTTPPRIRATPGSGLLRAGLLAITGPADFAEIYVDPWSARWADDSKNEFRWDTRGVADGSYYLIAELIEGKNAPYQVVSDYQVQVSNGLQSTPN